LLSRSSPIDAGRDVIRVLGVTLALLSLVVACGGTPSLDRMQADVQELAAVVPLLDEMGVVEFRSQDWCRALVFDGGRFLESDEETTCFMFAGDGAEFDEDKDAAFARIEDALDDTGTSVFMIDVTYADDGTLVEAAFGFDTGFTIPFAGSHDYVYSVDQPPMGWAGETFYTRIDANWHLAVEDWN